MYKKKQKVKSKPQKIDSSRIRLLKFKATLPFEASKKQIIYVENAYNPELNQFIEENYRKISKRFSNRGYEFAYIPVIQKILQNDSSNFIRYNYPNLSSNDKNQPKNIAPQDIYNALFSFMIDEEKPLNPGFIRYEEYTKRNTLTFSYFEIRFTSKDDLWKQINSYIQSVGNGDISLLAEESVYFDVQPALEEYEAIIPTENECRKLPSKQAMVKPLLLPNYNYSKVGNIVIDQSDYDFPEEANKVIDEIKTKINYLTQLGINDWVLQSLFTLDTTRKLSKLLITKDFKIILPDYDNREIHLTPLPKAIFLLFLKHPEGIRFKNLSNYKKELMNIYLNLSKRESIDTMEKSIDDLVNPTKNAINEKCSRIREAFIKEFDMRLADNYFITGERYSPKRIKLNRDLVCWETEV